jgi:hypothetical protein
MPALDIGLLRNLEDDETLAYEYQDSYPNYPEYQHNSAEQPEYGHVLPHPYTNQCPDTFIQCTDGLSGFSNHDSSSLAGMSILSALLNCYPDELNTWKCDQGNRLHCNTYDTENKLGQRTTLHFHSASSLPVGQNQGNLFSHLTVL